ncbi:MAG: transcription antitermination factor NusB [Actinomycetales bacterium]|uniref:Transcription antitermination protein NusB n=1 Tax=Candidatus Phosphoribacter hodrii TaxID=2953743 RepID=A0A935IK85_9MICO|nr:transcription antitermination factor NusB [Candidatus Phosphoribacter hodrii]MBP8838809.1 transcription antitermination factor NusB [Dermatophilaceae bacterium]MBK7272870.1 transcription antitermination factor NusB [Candidatus Phosphoribacter hodrii]MBL0004764.1 transcription antitermination factor NusB [Candidatus Phosphoribacter hodrii]HOR14294.1 transcription antitermination factor NusB [Dermatophilaceae bacterium]
MGARTKSRKRALDILFEADQRGINAQQLLIERLARPATPAPLADYTITLVEGVVRCWSEINEMLATYSQGWSVERMPAVDRAALRLATWEIVYSDEVPDAVAIDEAVELVKSLSTDESPAFVNGLLARIAEVKHTLG